MHSNNYPVHFRSLKENNNTMLFFLKDGIKKPSFIICSLTFILGFIFMPKDFYAGDSVAIKMTAINFVNTGKIGLPLKEREILGALVKNKDQYFFENEKKNKLYQRWGALNPITFAIPDLLSSTDDYEITSQHTFRHNIYNIILYTLFAFIFIKTLELFTKNKMAILLTSSSVLFSSILWHYSRAQAYEIFQVVFFSVFTLSLFKFKRTKNRKYKLLYLGSFICMVFTKSILFLCAPIIILYLNDFSIKRIIQLQSLLKRHLIDIVVISFCVSLFLFNQKFFFNEFFPIRTAHPANPNEIDFSIKFFWPRFKDYFFSIDKGIIFHFPLLIFSFINFKKFFKYRNEALYIISVFLIFSPVIMMFHTTGEWCIGPRYYLFILPYLALPAYIFFENSHIFLKLLAVSISSFATILLVISFTQSFHFSYRLMGHAQQYKLEKAKDDLSKHKFLIAKDLFFYLRNSKNEPIILKEIVEKNLSGKTYDQVDYSIRSMSCNLYWKKLCQYIY